MHNLWVLEGLMVSAVYCIYWWQSVTEGDIMNAKLYQKHTIGSEVKAMLQGGLEKESILQYGGVTMQNAWSNKQ